MRGAYQHIVISGYSLPMRHLQDILSDLLNVLLCLLGQWGVSTHQRVRLSQQMYQV